MINNILIIHVPMYHYQSLGNSGSFHLTERIRLPHNYALVFHEFELRTDHELSNFKMLVM